MSSPSACPASTGRPAEPRRSKTTATAIPRGEKVRTFPPRSSEARPMKSSMSPPSSSKKGGAVAHTTAPAVLQSMPTPDRRREYNQIKQYFIDGRCPARGVSVNASWAGAWVQSNVVFGGASRNAGWETRGGSLTLQYI